jgi:dipeptidase
MPVPGILQVDTPYFSIRRIIMGCTTMIVGKKATKDGSVIVAHSDDDMADERVMYVKAEFHKKGDKRPVYYDDASLGHIGKYNATALRRYIGPSRGGLYDTRDYPDSVPIGFIPYEKDIKTHAYFDANYGMMNECQLMIGECTCGAKKHPEPGPNRLFYAAELSRVALERCTKAREAIQLIGDLMTKYGYYGTGETLLIGDTEEAWVLEMCGHDKGTEGIWVAQRVPDEDFFVAANEFRIREVRDADDMLYSPNLKRACKENGWWDGSEPLDWLRAVSWGEYGHPYYALRRVWRAFSLVAPDKEFPAWVKDGYTKMYPFSIPPKNKLSVADVASIYRDQYQGTEFDQSKGLAAGPYGDPTRYDVNPDQQHDKWDLNVFHPSGAWERPISIYRCGTLWINQARSWLPDAIGGISWVGLDCPATNCLMPFYVGVDLLPEKMTTMNLLEFTREKSAYWAFSFVANYSHLKYVYMLKDIVQMQQELEAHAFDMIPTVDKEAMNLYKSSPADAKKCLTDFCWHNVNETVSKWWLLSDLLVMKYNNGCLTTDEDHVMEAGPVAYPRSWLAKVGFFDGPIVYEKAPAMAHFKRVK